MNHSCQPTVRPYEVTQLRGYFRIVFVAIRNIYPGDELTIDYSASPSTVSSPEQSPPHMCAVACC